MEGGKEPKKKKPSLFLVYFGNPRLRWKLRDNWSFRMSMQASDSSYLCPVFLASTLKSHNVLLGTSKDRMCPITSIHSLNAEGWCYLHVWIRYNRYQNHKNLALRAIELFLNL